MVEREGRAARAPSPRVKYDFFDTHDDALETFSTLHLPRSPTPASRQCGDLKEPSGLIDLWRRYFVLNFLAIPMNFILMIMSVSFIHIRLSISHAAECCTASKNHAKPDSCC